LSLLRLLFGFGLGSGLCLRSRCSNWVHVCVRLHVQERVFCPCNKLLALSRRNELYVSEVFFRNTLKFGFIQGHDLLNFVKFFVHLV
jgi:hypothetical protein